MQKTKLGISVALLGAALYFMGLINVIALVLLAGYVLLFEQNEWLRRCAVKSVALYVAFALLVGVISTVIDPISSMLGMWAHFYRLGDYSSLIIDIIYVVRFVVFGLLGVRALTMGSFATKKIDDLLNQHM